MYTLARMIALIFHSLILAASASPTVAVMGLGADPSAAGSMQQLIEQRLVEAQVAIVDANGVAARIGTKAVEESSALNAAVLADCTRLLDEATSAYAMGRNAQALDRLSALASIHSREGWVPASDRVRLFLWRTAVFRALQDDLGAEAEAMAALSIDPRLVVDLNELPPSVRDAVEKVRTTRLRIASVNVAGLPAGGQIKLDGRPVPARFETIVGPHSLAITAPGRRPVVRILDAQPETALRVALPIEFEPNVASKLEAIVWRGSAEPAEFPLLGRLQKDVGADWLLLIATRPGPSGPIAAAVLVPSVEWGTTSRSPTVALSAASSLSKWAASTISTGKPPKGRRSSGGLRALALAADGGAVIVSRSRSVGAIDMSLVGVGPRLAVEAARGRIFTTLEGSWATYGVSKVETTLPDGSVETVSGGSTAATRLGIGYRLPLGARDEQSPDVFISVGGAWEKHASNDVHDSGLALGMLPSHERIAAEVRAGVRFPIHVGKSRLRLRAGGGIAPWSQWKESPSGTSGTSPKPAPAFGWALGTDLQLSSGWDLGLEYAGERRSIRFTGAGNAPFDPGLQDAQVDEQYHSLRFTAAWRRGPGRSPVQPEGRDR